jgi:hypothetical protein
MHATSAVSIKIKNKIIESYAAFKFMTEYKKSLLDGFSCTQ